jgi:hypothetical protein
VAKYKAYREMLNEKPILWSDRKRILGLPLSFTRYRVDEDRLYMESGLIRSETNELLLYRVLDVKSTRTLGQKLVGVGTITLMSSDQSSPRLELKNIRDCERVRRFLSTLIEKQRSDLGIRGRELYGSGARPAADTDGDHPAPPPPPDLDGDGIPDYPDEHR